MAIDLTVRSGVTRSFPQPGDTDLFGEVTNWANDVTTAVNQSPTTSTSAPYDAVVGTAANVSAGVATHSDIATAIAAVSANDRIFILENTYEPSAQIDINKALTIIGQGEGAVIEGDNLVSGAVVKISASGVTFENCKIIQGSGTPDYALEIAASMERININLKADGTFATALYLNGSDIGAICGFIAYDTSSVFFGGEVQLGEQVKIQDQTTPAYNMVIQSDSDGTALTADRILTFDVNDGPRTIDLSENFTIGDGFDVTITAEDAAGAIVLDNSNFEVENTDGTQRLFKIVSAKAGDTTLTFQENFTLSDGSDVTMVAEDAAASITWDTVNFEVESTDGTQRTFKITSAKGGDTTLTFQENFTIGDGFDVTITSEDTANSIVLDKQNFEVEGEGTAQQLLKLVNANNAAATLTLEGTASVINQDVTSDASPTFVGPVVQKITRDSANIQIETTTSGDIDLASVDKTVRLNASDDTSANTQEILFGDDTGGITGVRNINGVMQYNSGGGGWFNITSSGVDNIVTKTTTYTATTSDRIILCDSSGGAFTVTLYAASGNSGRRLVFIKTTSDYTAVTIDGNASETINGNATTTINTQYERLTLLCDGTNWIIEQREADTGWQATTADFTWSSGLTLGNGTKTLLERRSGDSIEIQSYFNTGSTSVFGGNAQIVVPTGLTISSGDLVHTNSAFFSAVVTNDDNLNVSYQGSCFYVGNSTIIEMAAGDAGQRLTNTTPYSMATGDKIWITVRIPIDGWKGQNE